MEELLIASRLVHFGAVMVLFGSSMFPLYAIRQSDGAASSDAVATTDRWLRHLLIAATVAILLSTLGWLLAEAGIMGDGWSSTIDPTTIGAVVFNTGFGRVWQLQLTIELLLVIMLIWAWPRLHRRRHGRLSAVTLAAAFLVASQAWVGHAAMGSGFMGGLRLANQILHLGAGALWLGGLVPLGLLLAKAQSSAATSWQNLALAALPRFSSIGLVAVFLLVVTGVINTLFLVGSFSDLVETAYGQVLVIKIGLFLLMVGLAITNRLILLPRAKAHRSTMSALSQPLKALSRNVLLEQFLSVLVVGSVSILGTLPPAIIASH